MLHSLIILSFNKFDMTRLCLASVAHNTKFIGDSEIVVVDNGSTDGSVEWLDGCFAGICKNVGVQFRLIKNAYNVGCSTARNQALAAASGKYVTFLDNDVEPESSDWLEKLVTRIEASPKIGMVGAKMLYPSPSRVIQCAGVGISRRGRVCFLGRGESDENGRFDTPRLVQCLISACMMIRASLIRDYGGFDEVFNPVQFEDFDLCYRFRSHGYEAWFEPAARMLHHESTTTAGTATINNAAVVVRNGLRFKKKWEYMFSSENGPAESECRWRR